LKKIELTEKDKVVVEIIQLLEGVKIRIDELSEVDKQLAVYKKYCYIATLMYESFSKIKKRKIQEVYELIKGDMHKFYSLLHPNEPHKNVEIGLASTRRASTTLKIESFGRQEDPRALASEGHLDSIGLCIFLAFVKKFNEDCSLLVLDDVVTAIDSNHRDKICKLLFETFRDKQFIITTHDEVWYEQLRAAQRAYGIDGNFVNLMITNWDINIGPEFSPYKPRWDRIQDKIKVSDKSAGNEGRVYLEWLLGKICESTHAPVPYNSSGRYEVWELLTPAEQRLDSLISDATYKQRVADAFKDLKSTIIMGNLLSHYSILAEKITINEASVFCTAVYNLHQIFLCAACGNFIKYYDDLKILRCPNSKCTTPTVIKTK
jgi:ABC-type lipoprotein export system ATPase subunit